MFTGIIEEVGTVREAEEGRLFITCPAIIADVHLGDSVAINGVDLTACRLEGDGFEANLMAETYRRSNLGELRPGDPVNLERSLTPTTRISGHLVRGVVEGTGRLESLTPEGESLIARFQAPPELMRYVVLKGPIAVEGVSLTVIDRDDRGFAVSLVQYTQEHTNLARKKSGDTVNLETDIIARYVEQLLQARSS